jgi:hypothetical protein
VPSYLEEEGKLEHESRMLYGVKAALKEQDGFIPVSTVMMYGYTPTSGEETDTQMAVTSITGWSYVGGAAWDSAIRYSTSTFEEDNFGVWAPSSVIKVPLGEHWKAHAEYFGIFSSGREEESSQHYFSPGAHYLVTSNLDVGLCVGWGLIDQAANFFANAGFG